MIFHKMSPRTHLNYLYQITAQWTNLKDNVIIEDMFDTVDHIFCLWLC